MSFTRKKVNVTLTDLEMGVILNILETFSWQDDAVFKFARVDTKKQEKALMNLIVRLTAISNQNFNEGYIMAKMAEGEDLPYAQ